MGEVECREVQLVIELHRIGMPYKKILRELDRNGCVNCRGRPFSTEIVKKILHPRRPRTGEANVTAPG